MLKATTTINRQQIFMKKNLNFETEAISPYNATWSSSYPPALTFWHIIEERKNKSCFFRGKCFLTEREQLQPSFNNPY